MSDKKALAIEARYKIAREAPSDCDFYRSNDLISLVHDDYKIDERNWLLVPRYFLKNNAEINQVDYKFAGCQHIISYGDGFFENCSEDNGSMTVLDNPQKDFTQKTAESVLLAPNLESAITLRNADPRPVVVYYEPENLKAVAQVVRRFQSKAKLMIFADFSREPGNNICVETAYAVSKAINAKLYVPPFMKAGVDIFPIRTFNDLRKSRGLEGVQEYIEKGVSQMRRNQIGRSLER